MVLSRDSDGTRVAWDASPRKLKHEGARVAIATQNRLKSNQLARVVTCGYNTIWKLHNLLRGVGSQKMRSVYALPKRGMLIQLMGRK